MAESLERLLKRRGELWERMRALEPFFKGSVVELEVRCGKPNCRCTRGQKHRAGYVSLKREGKTQMHYLPRDRQEVAREASRRYREFQKLVEELSIVEIQILKRRGRTEDYFFPLWCKTVLHFFPPLGQWMEGIVDARDPRRIQYRLKSLLWEGVLLFTFRLGRADNCAISCSPRSPKATCRRPWAWKGSLTAIRWTMPFPSYPGKPSLSWPLYRSR